MPDTEVIKKSVTAEDYADEPRAGVYYLGIWDGLATSSGPLPPEPPAYWSRARDRLLRSTIYHETSYWASAVFIALTRMASLGWEVGAPDSPRLTQQARNLLTLAEAGRGWVAFLEKHLQDFLLTDNGAHIEIVRATKARGSRILGLMHLSSLRSWRTGDPDYPVIYRDRLGREHVLRDHQVISLADMPNPDDLYYGVGLSAASRAYRAIAKWMAVETYGLEKVTGSRPQSIYLAQGINHTQLMTAQSTADASARAKGAVRFQGATIIPVLNSESGAVNIAEIPLAGLPDGFDREKELSSALLAYANALGLDPQDLQPLSGQSLGTGAQSQVLDDKSRGRGLAAWRQQFSHLINEYVTPAVVTFAFTERDNRDLKQQADLETAYIGNAGTLLEKGLLDQRQAANYLADRDVIPAAWVPGGDETPATDIADDEKPEALAEEAEAAALDAATLPPPPAPTTEKALRLADRVMARARERAAQALGATDGR